MSNWAHRSYHKRVRICPTRGEYEDMKRAREQKQEARDQVDRKDPYYANKSRSVRMHVYVPWYYKEATTPALWDHDKQPYLPRKGFNAP